MKRLILASIIMLTTAFTANAENVIFSDNFESYTNNQLLTTVSVPTYGGAYVSGANTEIKAITGMVGRIGGAASANITVSLRKTIAVIAGHNYTFSAKTFSGQVNSRSIGYLFTTSGVTGNSTTLSNNIMTPQSVIFTAATSENVEIFVSNVGTAHLQTDDWLVTDNTLTEVNATKSSNFEFIQSAGGQFELKGNEVKFCKIYSAQGQLVKSFNTNIFHLNSLSKGVYILSATDKNGKSFIKKFIY